MTNPGTTTLVLAPTLRQSTELLLKIGGVSQLAGLKIASLEPIPDRARRQAAGRCQPHRLPARIE